MNKIVSLEQLLPARQAWLAAGRTLVFTNGVFDLLHIGHVRYLQEARSLGDVLIVGLNSDSSVRALKGPGRPLVPQTERAELLAALACVDHVTLFEAITARQLVDALRPEIYVKGGDYAQRPDTIQPARREITRLEQLSKPLPEAEVVLAYGGRVLVVPYLRGYSTTELIERIQRQGGDPGQSLPVRG